MKRLVAIATILLCGWHLPVYPQVFKKQQEALQQAFSEADSIERHVLFLTDEQVARIQKLAKAKLGSKIITFYKGVSSGSAAGFAFFETNIVRSKPETFMVVVTPEGKIKYVEVLAFYEPMDYFPTPNWFRLFVNRFLDDDLWPKREIHNITGATLTVQAITQGVRKILATYQVAIATEESH